MTLHDSLDQLDAALTQRGLPGLAPSTLASGGRLYGQFEVRNADGSVRRMQQETLELPQPLAEALAHKAPRANLAVDLGSHALTLWAPAELIELQVGYRWHGFTGKALREWDERFVVFAEDGGDPLALRRDQADGPVWLALRGEGAHHFFEAAPSLAAFYEALALFLESGDAGLKAALEARFGAEASKLWLWREKVTGELANR